MKSASRSGLTFPAGLGDDVSSTLAHHPGDVDRAVHTVAQSDCTEHCLSLQLHRSEQRRETSVSFNKATKTI